MLEKFLEDIGLTGKEAKVYLALLSVDSYSVLELSKKTGVKRTTVYPILEKLIADKLAAEIKIDNKVRYRAEPPERLSTFIEEQKLKLAEKSKLLQDFIPQLRSLFRESGERPIVKYYEGRSGIMESFNEYFETPDIGGTAYFVYPQGLIDKYFSHKELEQVRDIRTKKNIKAKTIYTFEKGERPTDATGTRVKVDEKSHPIKVDLGIYKDRVRIHTLGKNLSAIFIRSQDLADTLRTLFDLAFECMQKPKPEDNKKPRE